LATDFVGKDMALGQMYRVTGTPTFFVNGRLVRVVKQDDLHMAILEATIEAMKASVTR
jgi:protein-disulfide isomerase